MSVVGSLTMACRSTVTGAHHDGVDDLDLLQSAYGENVNTDRCCDEGETMTESSTLTSTKRSPGCVGLTWASCMAVCVT